jgi:hypothetical protein
MSAFETSHQPPCTEGERQEDHRLLGAQRGGVIIVTLFAAVFTIGLLFAMHGIGRAIRLGDAKRDAADSVARSSAVVYAHAMNQVALLNMVKLSTLSVLATHTAMMKGIADGGLYAGTMALADLSYLADVTRLAVMGIQHGLWLAQNVPVLLEVLRAAEQTQDALRTGVAQMAETRVGPLVYAFPLVTKGFVAPQRQLPIRSAPAWIPCGRLPGVPLQLFTAFKDLVKKDVGFVAGAASLPLVGPLCMAYAAASGSTKEVTAPLGREEYQLRGYGLGLPLLRLEESGVLVGSWFVTEGGGEVVRLREALSRIGIAQAEFYFDGKGPQTGLLSPLLFEMNWHARMRRYRPEGGFGEFRAACARAGGGGACGDVAAALQRGQSLIVH